MFYFFFAETGYEIAINFGTYGYNCDKTGKSKGNDTKNLKSVCEGQTKCSYRLPSSDPFPGCAKLYKYSYKCSKKPDSPWMTVSNKRKNPFEINCSV